MAWPFLTMKVRKKSRFLLLLLPLVGFCAITMSPYYAGRLSLVLHGHPFAHVTKDRTLDYVPTDSFRNAGIVLSHGKPIGWVYQPMLGFARFVPFTGPPNLDGSDETDFVFDYCFLVLWQFRWWFLAAQAVVLIPWSGIRMTRRSPRNKTTGSGSDGKN